MKESINSVPIFNIFTVLIFLFTGYICFSINLSKAYNVKNELVNIIKNQNGVCTEDSAISPDANCENFSVQIRDYFSDASYNSSGNCSTRTIGGTEVVEVGFDRNGNYMGQNASGAAFCVSAIPIIPSSASAGIKEFPAGLYYNVRVFYNLDIPFLNSLNFSITGETTKIYNPNECDGSAVDVYGWCDSIRSV